MHDAGFSNRATAQHLGCHHSTIPKRFTRLHQTGTTRDRPRPGQQRATTPRRFSVSVQNCTFKLVQSSSILEQMTVGRCLFQRNLHFILDIPMNDYVIGVFVANGIKAASALSELTDGESESVTTQNIFTYIPWKGDSPVLACMNVRSGYIRFAPSLLFSLMNEFLRLI